MGTLASNGSYKIYVGIFRWNSAIVGSLWITIIHLSQ